MKYGIRAVHHLVYSVRHLVIDFEFIFVSMSVRHLGLFYSSLSD